MENYGKTKKKRIRQVLQTKDEFGSRLRVRKVLTSHNVYLKTVTLIKLIKSNVIY